MNNNIISYQKIIESIPPKKLSNLSQKKIFFGHHSVGFNIIDGINDIMLINKNINLKIKETIDLKDFSMPVFAHSRIGQNKNWLSKINDFQSKIRNNLGDNLDIAFFKFCYVDITEETDVKKVFETYNQIMVNLEKEFPKTLFIYTTIPLRTTTTSWKTLIKKLIGSDYIWEYADNIKRNEFNEMIRHKYGETERLFDIAVAESTYSDGTQESFEKDGKRYASLIPIFTEDGGHLNEQGRKIIAAYLLKILSNVKD
jgi:hypothetical protein